MNAMIGRAKVRFGSYSALAAMLILLSGLFPEYRLTLVAALAVLAFWWLRLDPVGPDGQAFDPAGWKAGFLVRLHRLIG